MGMRDGPFTHSATMVRFQMDDQHLYGYCDSDRPAILLDVD